MVSWIECSDPECDGHCEHEITEHFADHTDLSPFIQALHRHQKRLYAFNSAFEMGIMKSCLDIDLFVHCVGVLVRLCNIGRGVKSSSNLTSFATYFGLGEKFASGALMMKLFNKSKEETLENIELKPEKYELYVEYCIRDTRLTYEILMHLPMRTYDTDIHQYTIDMNRRGLNIDQVLLKRLIEIQQQSEDFLNIEIARITKGLITSRSQYRELAYFLGVDSVNKDRLKDIELCPKSSNYKARAELLELLKQAAMGSLSKALWIEKNQFNGRVYDFIEFAAARTGRFGGRGLQIQNLPRTDYDEIDIVYVKNGIHEDDLIAQGKSCLRGLIQEKMTVVDYASIENRMIAWLSKDEERLEMFRNGGDDYKALASKIFNVPEEDIDKKARSLGKVLVLGGMYGGGENAILRSSKTYGLKLSSKEVKRYLDIYKEMYARLTREVHSLTRALDLVVCKGKSKVHLFRCVFSVETVRDRKFLKVLRPSGRSLWYPDIREMVHVTITEMVEVEQPTSKEIC